MKLHYDLRKTTIWFRKPDGTMVALTGCLGADTRNGMVLCEKNISLCPGMPKTGWGIIPKKYMGQFFVDDEGEFVSLRERCRRRIER